MNYRLRDPRFKSPTPKIVDYKKKKKQKVDFYLKDGTVQFIK